jgi:hypothetical protein
MACQGCGATRDEDVVFFLGEDAPEVTDEKLLEQAQAGADWLCQFCQTSNPPDQSHCRQCGAVRGSSASRPVREVRDGTPAPAAPAKKPRAGCGGRLLATLLLLVTGFCATLGYFAFRKTEERVSVAGFEWKREIEIEAFRKVRESAWEGEVPQGARILSRSREVHHREREQVATDKVKVGTRDLGNGFFEDVYEERPVYADRDVMATRVQYEIEEWVEDRTEKAEGGDQSPYWPDVRLASKEREGARRERYVVLLQGRKLHQLELPQERWASLSQGQTLSAVIRGGRTVLELK